MKVKKVGIFIYTGIAFLIIFLGTVFYKFRPKETVIEFAMFNGSNWGVAVKESYSVIDSAIEKFEKELPEINVFSQPKFSKKG